MTDGCPFCLPESARVYHESELVIGIWDDFPISPGHALLVPRRHIASWFDATVDEHRELTDAVEAARAAIFESHEPDGFNIGINVGEAAGQTIFHLHIHVIPRYKNDVDDPRGGVRQIIPGKARYWES
jgi:ATP adenylyltransferase